MSKTPKKPEKKDDFLSNSEPTDVKYPNPPPSEGKPIFLRDSSPHSEPPLPERSLHRIYWVFNSHGTPNTETLRKSGALKTIKMNHWSKHILTTKKWKIVFNTKKMEVFYRNQKNFKETKGTLRKLAEDMARLIYPLCEQAGISVEVVRNDNPEHSGGAHMVIEKGMDELAKYAEMPGTERVGLITDESHKGKPEFTGKESLKGSVGLDWLLLNFKNEFAELKEVQKHQSIAIIQIAQLLKDK